MKRLKINEQVDCYLTERAKQAIGDMVNAGIDRDLALEVLENLWTDIQIYELPALEGDDA